MVYNAVWGFSLTSFYFIYSYLAYQEYITYLIIYPAFFTLVLVVAYIDETPSYLLLIKNSPQAYKSVMHKIGKSNLI